MSLFKRGSVYWSYFYVDGIRYQQSTRTSNRKQAEQIEAEHRAEVNARRHQPVPFDASLTFGALAARFVAQGDPKPHHLDRLRHLLPYFGQLPILRITKGMTREYRKRRKSARRIKDATVNRDLSVLRHILYWALDEQLLPSNPLTRLRMERERRSQRPVMHIEEEQQLVAASPPHLKGMILAALDTGMRRGEILNQRWEHIDLDRRLLSVTRSKTAEGEAREIPLTTRLLRLLLRSPQEEGPAFVYRKRPVRSVKTAWKAAIGRSGIRHFRFHDLRHTFNTRLMEAGVLQEVRKALMGHSSGQGVHSSYTHIELPVKREAIARLEEWMKSFPQQPEGGKHANT